ncbi:hypothetical protein M9H77_27660 [Catharanthus roseus]|uniref:Uncharacterized protein n=1 Tax=Catharanthus roseus TaxID=4058 RepID=A0ACC0AEK4_CATRO|nr:hypothetical protein M9H77_27660 [Catharanthus roseus]
MVEDNGKDESVEKPTDAFCNLKEVAEGNISKGPGNVNLEYEHSAINVHRSLNDDQVKVIKPFEYLRTSCRGLLKFFYCERWRFNVHGKIMFVDEKDIKSMLGIKRNCDTALERELGLEIEHGMIVLPKIRERLIAIDSYGKEFIMKYVLFIVGKFLSPLTKSLQIRELNWSKFVLNSIVISVRKWNRENKGSITDLRDIGVFRGENIPIVDVEELGMDVHLDGVHKRLDLLDQNMKQLRGGLEGVREEVACIGKSVKAANRSVTEVKDELRDIRDDIREDERIRQKNSDIQYENKDKFGSGNRDVNDETGAASNKMVEWKIENKEAKETSNEYYLLKWKHVNGKGGQEERLREPREVINCFACMLLSRARQGNVFKGKTHIQIFNQFLTVEKYGGNVASCEKVHSISHRNDVDICLFLDASNFSRDCILKGWNGPFYLATLFRAHDNISFYLQ